MCRRKKIGDSEAKTRRKRRKGKGEKNIAGSKQDFSPEPKTELSAFC